MGDRKGPDLSGLKALDLTDPLGSFCGRVLADLGVDVVKIEPPDGDKARGVGPFFHDEPDPEKGLWWFALNAGKRGITLNIESERGRSLFLRMAEQVDFVLESFPPGYLKKLGLDYPKLREINPRLVMTSISPFGQEGPYSFYKASDLVLQAMGGWAFMCGNEDRPPVRFSLDQALFHAGIQASAGTLIAYYCRQQTGSGQHVDVSAQEALTWPSSESIRYWLGHGDFIYRSSDTWTRGTLVLRRVYPCKDGYVSYQVAGGIMLGPMQQRMVKLMDEEGMAGELKDIDWKAIGLENMTQANLDRWQGIIELWLKTKTKAELQNLAVKHGLIFCPVNEIKDLYEYSQLSARDYWKSIDHDQLKTSLKYPGFLFKSSLFSPGPRSRAPLLGEHNRDIWIREMGVSEQDFGKMKKEGVV